MLGFVDLGWWLLWWLLLGGFFVCGFVGLGGGFVGVVFADWFLLFWFEFDLLFEFGVVL